MAKAQDKDHKITFINLTKSFKEETNKSLKEINGKKVVEGNK